MKDDGVVCPFDESVLAGAIAGEVLAGAGSILYYRVTIVSVPVAVGWGVVASLLGVVASAVKQDRLAIDAAVSPPCFENLALLFLEVARPLARRVLVGGREDSLFHKLVKSGTAQADTTHQCMFTPMFCSHVQTHLQRADNRFDRIQGLFRVGEGTRFDNAIDRFFGVK